MWVFFVDWMGRGRDDSDSPGRRLSGPEGGRDSGPSGLGPGYVTHRYVTCGPRPGLQPVDPVGLSSLRLRCSKVAWGAVQGHSVVAH